MIGLKYYLYENDLLEFRHTMFYVSKLFLINVFVLTGGSTNGSNTLLRKYNILNIMKLLWVPKCQRASEYLGIRSILIV